jgi:hypothetical protein
MTTLKQFSGANYTMEGIDTSFQSSVVDITTLNAVESIFRKGTKDPWGRQLAGKLAEFFIYSDQPRFTMPIYDRSESISILPSILSQFESRDKGLFVPLIYEVDEKRILNNEYLLDAFSGFDHWARNSRSSLARWIKLHNEDWIKKGHLARVRPRYVFDVNRISNEPILLDLTEFLGVSVNDVLYSFDVVLRYPLYGELAGPNVPLFAHPIREVQNLPTMKTDESKGLEIALSLKDAVYEMVPAMSLDDYTSFLHEARGIVRQRNVHKLKPGALDREATRDIAQELGLPARLNGVGKVMGISAGLITSLGGVASLAPAMAILGGVVSVATVLWEGALPSEVSRISWLRWALKWEIEKQASDAV